MRPRVAPLGSLSGCSRHWLACFTSAVAAFLRAAMHPASTLTHERSGNCLRHVNCKDACSQFAGSSPGPFSSLRASRSVGPPIMESRHWRANKSERTPRQLLSCRLRPLPHGRFRLVAATPVNSETPLARHEPERASVWHLLAASPFAEARSIGALFHRALGPQISDCRACKLKLDREGVPSPADCRARGGFSTFDFLAT
jgi:hypothetical protein